MAEQNFIVCYLLIVEVSCEYKTLAIRVVLNGYCLCREIGEVGLLRNLMWQKNKEPLLKSSLAERRRL